MNKFNNNIKVSINVIVVNVVDCLLWFYILVIFKRILLNFWKFWIMNFINIEIVCVNVVFCIMVIVFIIFFIENVFVGNILIGLFYLNRWLIGFICLLVILRIKELIFMEMKIVFMNI